MARLAREVASRGRVRETGARGTPRGRALVRWFRRHRRPLPWRRDRSPYRIWVAEVLLQQTRVAQAIPYFERFLRRFPDPATLARASEGAVLKAWEGAGYYARARRLREAARQVVDRHGGELPRRVDDLEALPGVGPYIARAVASLAFGAPIVALEANGLRVAARWALEPGDPARPAVRRRLAATLAADLPPSEAGDFNEAIMELGETICRPAAPRCPVCPVARWCRARRELPDPGSIPHRRGRRERPHVLAAVVAVEARCHWLVQRRPAGGLLGGLWEFPGGKIRPGEAPATAARRELREETGLDADRLDRIGVVRHAYSHFSVDLHLFRARVAGPPAPTRPGRRWVTPAGFARLPRPRATQKAVALLLRRPRDRRGGASPGSGSRRGRTRT